MNTSKYRVFISFSRWFGEINEGNTNNITDGIILNDESDLKKLLKIEDRSVYKNKFIILFSTTKHEYPGIFKSSKYLFNSAMKETQLYELIEDVDESLGIPIEDTIYNQILRPGKYLIDELLIVSIT